MADETKNDKILSQNEVDALLNAVKDGEVSTESKAGDGSNLQVYDFTKQRKLVRGRMPGLKIIFDRFQRSYKQTLSSLVRKVAVVEYAQTEFLRYSEWISTLPNPSCLSIMRLSPLIGQSVISIEPSFVFTLIDNIFGGGKFAGQKRKEGDFTTIELKMIQKMTQYFSSDLEKAWSSVYPLEFEYVRTDVNPEYVSIMAPSDVVIVSDFTVSFESVTTRMQLVIPLFALDPIKSLLSDHTYVEQSQPNPNWRVWLSQNIGQAKAPMHVLLGKTSVTMRQILSLNPGDTVQLEHYVADPLPLFVEGVRKFDVRMGTSCGQKAVQIEWVGPMPEKNEKA